MRSQRDIFFVCIPGIIFASMASAQAPKPGLYEVTNRMTWQRSPFPDGMQEKPGGSAPHTAQTCITQAQIDKFNGPKPQASGPCQIGNIQKHHAGMTAEMTCTGSTKGKGTVETVWTDSGHSKSKVHFTGEMQIGPNSKTVEWTIDSESTFKSPDCGSVKPSDSGQ
jgi:uncharacterized protein DUF3617